MQFSKMLRSGSKKTAMRNFDPGIVMCVKCYVYVYIKWFGGGELSKLSANRIVGAFSVLANRDFPYTGYSTIRSMLVYRSSLVDHKGKSAFASTEKAPTILFVFNFESSPPPNHLI